MKYFFVYILRCSDGSYYTGHTDNLEKRVSEHKLGKCSGYTSQRLPVELIFSTTFHTRDEAFVAERKIKSWTRAKKEAVMRDDWQVLTSLLLR